MEELTGLRISKTLLEVPNVMKFLNVVVETEISPGNDIVVLDKDCQPIDRVGSEEELFEKYAGTEVFYFRADGSIPRAKISTPRVPLHTSDR